VAEPTSEQIIHRLKNHLCVIVGFCDLLIAEIAADDPRRADLLEVNKAAREAMLLMPEVVSRMRDNVEGQ
jgi:hypothetical protein